MRATKQAAWMPLCFVGGASAICGIAVIAAGAQQRSNRPFIPRAGDVRPITRSQPPALPPPSASSKAAPGGDAIPGLPAKPAAEAPKMAGLRLLDPDVDEKTGIVLGRDFTYTEDDMTVTGSKAKYNKNSKVLDAEGSLVMNSAKHHVTGDVAHVETKKQVKHAVFDGNVVIVIKPKEKPAGSTDDVASEKGKGGTITCDHVDDFYGRKFVILKGNLVFKQKITKKNGKTVERTLTAEHAEFDENADKLHLFAPVDMKDTDNQEAHFTKDVFVGTKEGEETLKSESGSFKFNVDQDEDDSDKSEGAKPNEKGPTADTGAGKDASGAGKQDNPAGAPDKKQDPAGSTPGQKQDPPVKKT